MSTLAGTAAFTKLAGRRDRIMLPIWIYAIAGTVVSTIYLIKKVYPTVVSREQFALVTGHNPSLLALYGPIYGDSIGSLTAWRYGVFAAVGAGLMSIFLVIRHTRGDEESGRLELLGSAAVGRPAALVSAVLLAAVANLVVAVLIAALLPVFGATFAGSAAMGLMIGGAGLVFTAVAAITAQLAQSARTARGIALGVLGACYLLRAVGDAAGASGPGWLTWLSPVGWVEQIRPFGQARWWVAALPVLAGGACLVVAALLAAGRDYDAGLIGQRLGRPAAKDSLRGPLSLAWRLQRGSVIGWLASGLVFAVVIGAATKGIGDLINTPAMRNEMALIGGHHGIIDAFLAAMMSFLALLAAGFAISTVLRLRSEETDDRAEPVLAGSVSRVAWGLSHLVIAAVGTVALLMLMGLGLGLGYVARSGGGAAQIGQLVGAGLAQVPAVLVLAGLTVALFGLAPKASVAGGWSAFGVVIFLLMIGSGLRLSHWIMDVSPFTHIPKVPGGAVSAAPMIVLCVIALVLALAGLAGLRRRDIG